MKYYQLKEQEHLVMVLKRESDVRIFLLEPGQDFFMHYEYWPRTIPTFIKHESSAIMLQDVSIKKQQKILNQDCRHEQKESYLGKPKTIFVNYTLVLLPRLGNIFLNISHFI